MQARNHHGSGLWYSEVTRSRHVAVATPEVQHAEAIDRAEYREERWVDEGAVPEVALIAQELDGIDRRQGGVVDTGVANERGQSR